jgi:N-acetylneuraminic acid mutarotase
MYVFGGIVSSYPAQDTHKIDLATLEWSGEIITSGTKPTARYYHTSVSYDKYMYVFGGTYDGTGFNDTHRLDLTNNAWSGGLDVSGTKPVGRNTVACVYGNYMYVFGGYTTAFVNDLHRLNLDTLAWSGALGPTGTPPSIRCGHSVVTYGNYMYVFGGYAGAAPYYNDLHRLNLDTLVWSGALSPTGTPPGTRYFHQSAVYGRYMYVFGGNNASGTDPHRIDLDNLVWSGALTCSGTPAAYRTAHTGVTWNDGFYIFSGSSQNNDLHRLQGLM